MRTHPLLAVADTIDPDEVYTLAALAELTGRARSTVNHWLRGGFLGEPRSEEGLGAAAGWRWVLDGAVLLEAIHAPTPVQDHTGLKGGQAWRRGCRDDTGTCACREHHNHSTRQARQRRADERFPATTQREFLHLVQRRMSVPEAAEAVGVTEAIVHGYAGRDPQFAERLEAARKQLCRQRADCGSGAGWRSGCRGLWCWQQHTESRARTRTGPRGRARADDVARAFGYPDVADYLAAHPDTPTKRLAATLGVGHSSVKRWREEVSRLDSRPSSHIQLTE